MKMKCKLCKEVKETFVNSRFHMQNLCDECYQAIKDGITEAKKEMI